MLEWIISSSVVSAIVAGGGAYLISKRMHSVDCKLHLEKAYAKAKAIEYEAESLLKDANIRAKEVEMSARSHYENEVSKISKEYESRLIRLEQQESKNQQILDHKLSVLEMEKIEIGEKKRVLESEMRQQQKLRKDYAKKLDELLEILCNVASFTKDQAKELAIQYATESAQDKIVTIVKKYENEAREEGRRKANYILAQATTRFAGEFASERLINVVSLPNDELKGRIIGKEGRNIKALEMLLGVDIIIDDTPNAIVLSSFNLYRRAIATRVIERLVEDGHIQPARIEEIFERVKQEFEEKILEEGEDVLLKLGLSVNMHTELKKLIGRLKYRASYGQNALGHSLEVAHLAGLIAGELGGDVKIAKRAGLLHDIGKALTHDFEGSHVTLGEEVCQRYNEHPIVLNAIMAHHGHEEIKSIECAAVCAADALSSARPGARREVLENFLNRVKEIEEIAVAKCGVTQAYAINAGRELRVIVNADILNDGESVLLADEIAKEIESRVQYPGDVKVSVIREVRAVSMAH